MLVQCDKNKKDQTWLGASVYLKEIWYILFTFTNQLLCIVTSSVPNVLIGISSLAPWNETKNSI